MIDKKYTMICSNKYPTSVKLLDNKLNLPGHIRVVVFKETLKDLLHSLYNKHMTATIITWNMA